MCIHILRHYRIIVIYSLQAQRELHELMSAREKERARGEEHVRFFQTLARAPVLKPLLLINVFNILQILSGSYVLIFYAQDIVQSSSGNIEPKTNDVFNMNNRRSRSVIEIENVIKIGIAMRIEIEWTKIETEKREFGSESRAELDF
ncbi:hypothetical protein EVAR_11902_1 [Eumeta japonica]|uniref:Uncharacterized protein n=1 Tax=Eumeta variegata TaxID=151549 RepID=A0A4C1U922_EUMVA|nr:hypothetical protein EVAR_11902_1 [Eumeta japonica]